jgi:hypothetical protein
MRPGLFQDRLGALRPERDRALAGLHSGLQHIVQTELDWIEGEFGGDFVDHQLGRR